MILKSLPPEWNNTYLVDHHIQTRNLLFAILGYVYLMKSKKADMSDEQIEFLKEIEKLCFQLLDHEKSLISRLLLQNQKLHFPSNQLN
ncbi:MAG: hypothetical protein WHT29_10975 [Bacteroidales bacterium]|nr:hypothetical protein [Bacteroidales bacterium]HPO65526.1 hypothetical protein [Bacteroidales bacterium]